MLDLFPDSAATDQGELALGGVRATALADEFGTPLYVYCEQTIRAQARAYRAAAPDALVAYGSKAFPNLAVLELLAEEGLGADVSTLGELELARRAGIPGERLVVHGNNKSDEELRAAAEARAAFVVLDSPDEVERAAAAGVERVLVRVTSGIEADTHEAIRTGTHGSKFGLTPEDAVEALRAAAAAGLDPAGLHVHVGSQLLDTQAARMTVEWLGAFAAVCAAELNGWQPAVVDLGGGLGVRHVEDEEAPSVEEFAGELLRRLERAWELHGLARPLVVLEPGRSIVGRAGVALYRVGSVKRAGDTTTWVAVDGGMSDNPRPQLYGARYTAVIAGRPEELGEHAYAVTGKHCEEEILIRRVLLPEPRRGDVLAIPAAGAYTLAMSSNYNLVPRPAAVLVGDGDARLIRRRETLDDMVGLG
ncbi:MAG: diaminopimelate decarboxylase [Gaiellaceae bacterium]